MVSASGDASLRLVYGDRVQPVNTALVPNYADIFPDLKDKPWNSVNGVSYGIPHGRGANLLLYNKAANPTPPTSWKDMWDPNSPAKGKISPYDDAIYIADAAVYLMATQPDLGIKNPYALDQKQFDAAIDAAQAAEAAGRRVLGRLRQAGPGPRVRRGRAGPGLAAHGQPRQRRRRQGGHDQAQGGRHRLVGHVDGQEGHREHQLLVPVAELHRVAAGQRADRGVLRRGAREPEVVRAHRRTRTTARSSTPRRPASGTTSTTGRRRRPTASTGARTPSASPTTTGCKAWSQLRSG